MSNVHKPAVAGQEIDPTVNPDSDLAKILAAIRGIGTRLDVLEQRFEYLDRDVLKAIKSPSLPVPEHLIEERPEEEPDTDREPEPERIPTIAISVDGHVLLSTHYLTGADLSERRMWTGIILTEAEACDALDAISDGADDAAAHVGGRIIAKARKKGEPEGEGGDENV